MRQTLLALAAIACLAPGMAYGQYRQEKEVETKSNTPLQEMGCDRATLWNFGWEFSDGNDRQEWRQVDLPHDFQIELPWTDRNNTQGFKPVAEGWYRKRFMAPQEWRGKRVTLDFDGLLYYGDVYLNGNRIGGTEYGYCGFEADMTPYLDFNGENTLEVYANTANKKASRWYTGAGLVRDVNLVVTNPTHISRNGVFITTENNEDVSVQVELEGWKKKNIDLALRIRDENGNVVAESFARTPEHNKYDAIEIKFPTVRVDGARLWDLDDPYLYNADVIVYENSVAVDSVREQFGVRTLEFSPEFGFRLNGRKVFMKGNSGHHDMGALGAAAFEQGIERMMKTLKKFGYNTVRCSHNPYSRSFAKTADRLGMLVVAEAFDKWSDKDYWGGRKPFSLVWPSVVTEMVKRDRNSPSVVLWSLGNELQIREDWTGYPCLNDRGVTMYRIMREVVRRWDPTRLTTVGQYPARAGAISRKDKDFNDYLVPPELSCATDVASFNYQSKFYKNYSDYNPDLIIFQSEAETSGWLEPYFNMDYDRHVGMCYWGSIEYWGESNGWPKKGWNYSFFDHTLNPYPQAWLVKSAFEPEEDVIRIGVLDTGNMENVEWNDINVGQMKMLSHWNFPEGSRQTVYVFTNASSAELIVNGKSLGIKDNDGTGRDRNVLVWKDVDYGRGGSIKAIGYDRKKKTVAEHRVATAGKVAGIRIIPEKKHLKADGMDLLYLNLEAVDRSGNLVPDFEGFVDVSVRGEARLHAIDDGNHFTDELFHNLDGKKMRGGRLQVILRATNQPGKVDMRFSSGKLKGRFSAESI